MHGARMSMKDIYDVHSRFSIPNIKGEQVWKINLWEVKQLTYVFNCRTTCLKPPWFKITSIAIAELHVVVYISQPRNRTHYIAYLSLLPRLFYCRTSYMHFFFIFNFFWQISGALQCMREQMCGFSENPVDLYFSPRNDDPHLYVEIQNLKE